MSNVQIAELLQWVKNLWGLIPKHYLIVLYFGGTVFAFLNCFMGYRLRKVWGCILGIILGGGAGAAVGFFLLQDKMMAILCAAGGALILGLLAWLLYKFGIFFMCTGLVYFLVVSFFQEPTMTQHMIALVVGIFAATLALGYEAQMMIGITAICGGIGGIHLLMKMLEKDAGAGEVILGVIMAAIGIAVQAAPFMREKDWEASLFHRPQKKKGPGRLAKRKKKVVKKTKVTQVKKIREEEKTTEKRKPAKKQQEKVQTEAEAREELQKTQEYTVGQKQYEKPKPSQSFYQGSGIGIDLDDLNRELSQEIQKIYEDEQRE